MCEGFRTVLRALSAGLLAILFVVTIVPTGSAQAASTAVATSVANVRSGPSTDSAIVGMLVPGDTFTVVDEVAGEEVVPGNNIWFQSSFGNFVYSDLASTSGRGSVVARGSGGAGRQIVVDRSSKIAQAIENGRTVYTAPVTVGRPGWETPGGSFTVLRRVANETMSSSTIGIPLGSPGSYHLTGVLFTQYFTDWGAALHYNYWSSPGAFGSSAESRGCVGLQLADAEFFWNFAGVGTPVTIY